MPTITIDDKDYDYDSLSDTCKNLLTSVQFAQTEIKNTEARLNLLKTAAATYSNQLKAELSE
tara:strand:+ start:453 stop:638 length:186 start_codon:yes stop_codon:yes gene_type:complete